MRQLESQLMMRNYAGSCGRRGSALEARHGMWYNSRLRFRLHPGEVMCRSWRRSRWIGSDR